MSAFVVQIILHVAPFVTTNCIKHVFTSLDNTCFKHLAQALNFNFFQLLYYTFLYFIRMKNSNFIYRNYKFMFQYLLQLILNIFTYQANQTWQFFLILAMINHPIQLIERPPEMPFEILMWKLFHPEGKC